jgi:dihydrofolate synthase/folylpolyglutamate synthase
MIEPHWLNAYDKLLRVTMPGDLGVVTGTLYLIADVRSWILYGTMSEKGR